MAHDLETCPQWLLCDLGKHKWLAVEVFQQGIGLFVAFELPGLRIEFQAPLEAVCDVAEMDVRAGTEGFIRIAVDAIPALGSGKTDFQRIKKIAAEFETGK